MNRPLTVLFLTTHFATDRFPACCIPNPLVTSLLTRVRLTTPGTVPLAVVYKVTAGGEAADPPHHTLTSCMCGGRGGCVCARAMDVRRMDKRAKEGRQSATPTAADCSQNRRGVEMEEKVYS